MNPDNNSSDTIGVDRIARILNLRRQYVNESGRPYFDTAYEQLLDEAEALLAHIRKMAAAQKEIRGILSEFGDSSTSCYHIRALLENWGEHERHYD